MERTPTVLETRQIKVCCCCGDEFMESRESYAVICEHCVNPEAGETEYFQ
jgi:hypothetical protein